MFIDQADKPAIIIAILKKIFQRQEIQNYLQGKGIFEIGYFMHE